MGTSIGRQCKVSMFMCSEYICNKCGCIFWFPNAYTKGNATEDFTVPCPKCNSNDCELK